MADDAPPVIDPWSNDVPDLFTDVFWLSVNPWSASIVFGIRRVASEHGDRPITRARMSPAQAKALGILLLRNIRAYETAAEITVELPEAVLKELGIAPEDWKRFGAE